MAYTRAQLEEAAAGEYNDLVMAAYRDYRQSVDACGLRLTAALNQADEVKRRRLARIEGVATEDESGTPVLPLKGPGSRQDITAYVRTVIEQNTLINHDTTPERLAAAITYSVLARLGFMELGGQP